MTQSTGPMRSTDRSARPRLSLLFPALNEAESAGEIVEFYRDISAAHPDIEMELVLVDDGSTDGTADAVRAHLADGDLAVLMSLSRNFGSHAAITAGLAACSGDAALTLSADRQEPLEAVADFIATWQAGADVVWGLRQVRATRRGVSDVLATSFSKVFNRTSTVPTYPADGPSQILVTRRVMDVLATMSENNRNVLAMAAWTGFDQRTIYFQQLPRPYGTSRWTSAKKTKLVIDSFVEFSAAPMRWLLILGGVLGMAGVVALVIAFILLFVPGGAAGLTAVAGVVLCVGGLNLFALGGLGEYLWRAGDDARRRPVYIVGAVERVGHDSED